MARIDGNEVEGEMIEAGDAIESSSNHGDEVDEDFENKQKKTGLVYFSTIPPKFTVMRLRQYFENTFPGQIGRIYLMRNKHSKSKENRYSEGWMEVKKKKTAKEIVQRIDNTPVGGKRRDYVSSLLWNIKYLSGFKWVHLTEQLQFENRVEQRRMQVEIAQARRVATHFEEQLEKGRHLKKLEQRALTKGDKWETFSRDVVQKDTVHRKKKPKVDNKTTSDDLLGMVFDK